MSSAARTAAVLLAAAFGALVTMPACSGSRPPAGPGTGSGAEAAGAGATRVVAYFAEWGPHARSYHVKDVQDSGAAAKLTHLVYAFGTVAGGRCAVIDGHAAHQRSYPAATSVDGVADTPRQPLRGTFNQLRKLKELNPRLQVLWSFGGWTHSGGFTQAAGDPAAFAESCHRLVEDPRWADVFDGIDVDWEYPNACGLTCDRSGPDAFENVTSALRSRFGSTALVTAAITADGNDGGRVDAADYAGAAVHLDWVMAMTYDYAGTREPRGPTAPHSPLTGYPGIPQPGGSAEAGIRKLRSIGVPADKLLLGISSYGRGWTGVSQPAPGGSATGPAPGRYEDGIEDYRILKDRCPATGTIGGTAYAFCSGQWWAYDTPATIAGKMAYAGRQGLGGAFLWELSGDTPDGELINAIRSGLG